MPKLEGGARRSKRATKTAAKRKSSPAKKKTNGAVKKKTNGAVKKTKVNGATGRPAIIPSQSVHHCTPPVVAEGIVYPVLGDPVDLDPCSNKNSIIRARRTVILPEDGLTVPWHGNVYVNPPYGMPEILEWVKKCVVEHRNNGAQIVALLPAHCSSEWFDLVAATARGCFFWGPGIGTRRLKFIGNKDSAAFHSAVVYWGADLPLFTRCALRYCHPWFPEHDLRLARALIGDVRIPEGAAVPLAAADELLTLARNDDLASALAALGSATLGDILDAGDTILRARLRQVCAYELGAALLYASRTNGKAWVDHRIPRVPQELDPRQLDLMIGADDSTRALAEPAAPPRAAPRTLDDMIFDEISRGCATGDPVTASTLKQRLACSQGQLRGALGRLRDADKIEKAGRTQGARYFVKGKKKSHGSRKQT